MKIILAEDRNGQLHGEHTFTGDVVLVGRDPAVCHYFFSQEQWPMVSRKHAEFRLTNGRYLVNDANSRFGTFVNGQKITAPVSENRELFHSLAEKLSAQFKLAFPGYRKVSEGEIKMGAYDAYEFRFEGLAKDTAKGNLNLWGRVILLPPQDGGKDGVTLLMLATSLAPELTSLDDVGVKGELPMMLQSFRFGKQ